MPSSLGALRFVAAGALGSIAFVHALWATGSSLPAADRRALATAVIGRTRLPSAGPSLAVASLLGVAAVFVAGNPSRVPRIRRAGAGGVAFVLFARGAVGIAGAMPHDRRSPVFARLNRRFYSPLCLVLATLAAVSAAGGSSGTE